MLVLADTTAMDQYVTDVTSKANHHAASVLEIVPMLRHMVEAFGNDTELSKRHHGRFGNESWFYSKRTGRRFHLGYNHNTEMIELRRYGRGGPLEASFDNATTAVKLFATFNNI